MAVAKSVDTIGFSYTDHTDRADFSVFCENNPLDSPAQRPCTDRLILSGDEGTLASHKPWFDSSLLLQTIFGKTIIASLQRISNQEKRK